MVGLPITTKSFYTVLTAFFKRSTAFTAGYCSQGGECLKIYYEK